MPSIPPQFRTTQERVPGTHDLFGDSPRPPRRGIPRRRAFSIANYSYDEAYTAHPEWLSADPMDPVKHNESPCSTRPACSLRTSRSRCRPSSAEINSLYDVDGFFTNGWPSTGRLPVLLRALPRIRRSEIAEIFRAHLDRVPRNLEAFGFHRKQKSGTAFTWNLGGGIRAVTDLPRSLKSRLVQCRSSGRTGQHSDLDCAQQGARGAVRHEGKAITNVTGAYANSHPLWRHTAKSPQEATVDGPDHGQRNDPWYHWLACARRHALARTGQKFFQWIRRNEKHFVNRESVANLGVVFQSA